MNYTTCIPKNCDYHLSSRFYSLRLLGNWFTRWSPLFDIVPSSWMWSNGSMFRFSNDSIQKFIWITLKSPNIFEIITSCLRSTVNKRGTHLADSFFILNCSCKIEITVPCDMPVASTSSRTFTRRSVKTISWILSMISDVAASIGRLERGASHVRSFKFIHPIVYSCKLYTGVDAIQHVLWTLSNSALISFGVKLFICRCFTARNSFLSIL